MFVVIDRLRGFTSKPLVALLGLCLSLAPAALSIASASDADGLEKAAASEAPVRSDDEVLMERALEYWEARVNRSAHVMDFYASPEEGGPTRPKDVSEFGNIGYKSWSLEGVEVDGDEAIVKVKMTIAYTLPTPVDLGDKMTRTIRERWLKVGGTWYKEPIPLGFSHGGRSRAAPPASEGGAQGAVATQPTGEEAAQP